MTNAGWGAKVRSFIEARIVLDDRGHSTPCWIWQRVITEKGYAKSDVAGVRNVRIHRASYEAYVGPIPNGLHIDHLCRVKCCVNPEHLEPVTNAENAARRAAAERACRQDQRERRAAARMMGAGGVAPNGQRPNAQGHGFALHVEWGL